MNLRRWLLLTILLLVQANQIALAVHKSDLAAHGKGVSCETCLHFSASEHTAVDNASAAPITPASPPIAFHSHFHIDTACYHYPIRAPPR